MSFMVVECAWCGETYTFGVVGMSRSERSNEFDTAELVLRVDGRRFLIEVRELED